MIREGNHKPGTWGDGNIRLVNCAGCGVELRGTRREGVHLPRWASDRWGLVFVRIFDAERPLAKHTRPYCGKCGPAVVAGCG